MRSTRAAVFTTLALATVATNVYAQEPATDKRRYVFGEVLYGTAFQSAENAGSFRYDLSFKNAPGFKAGLGQGIQGFSFELAGSYLSTNPNITILSGNSSGVETDLPGSVKLFTAEMGAAYRKMVSRQFIPYLYLGFSLSLPNWEDTFGLQADAKKELETAFFGYVVGGGFDVFFTRNVGVGVRGTYNISGVSDERASIAVDYGHARGAANLKILW